MKALLRLSCIALFLALASCTTDVNPVDIAPQADVTKSGDRPFAIVLQPDGSYTFDVDVPTNQCGVPAGMFAINVVGLSPSLVGMQSWHASNGTYDVTKQVAITWTKNSSFPMPEKTVTTWTVKVLPDGPTVTWIETWSRTRGKTSISKVKCA